MTDHKASKGVTLVAGGSGGVGAAICSEFASRGSPLAFTYHRNEVKAEDLLSTIIELGGPAQAYRLDLTDAEAASKFVQTVTNQFGAIQNVIYAAGPAFEMAFVSKINPKSWADVFATDVNGCFNLFHAALQQLRKQKFGNLVALSTCALKRPPRADVLSAAPKAAIDMLVKCIAKEEGRYGIRANTVELGFIAAGNAAYHMEHVWSPQLVEDIKGETPLRRFGTGAEVAKAVAFLCSEDANFITGESLSVDGGSHL